MKSLFDADAHQEIALRLGTLHSHSQRQWGKMDVAQMLAHCSEAFLVPLSDKAFPRMWLGRLFGWMMKAKLYNDTPWRHNLPTAPNFVINDKRDFEREKKRLLELVDQFYNHGKRTAGKYPHPFFGSFTQEQWGMSMYKHLDHHLQQFGV